MNLARKELLVKTEEVTLNDLLLWFRCVLYHCIILDEITGNNFTCLCAEGMEGPLCDTPYCLKQHCENGYCNTTRDVPICQCQLGFEGKYCEININDCLLPAGGSPCKNGGVCIDGIARYDCNCTGTGNSFLGFCFTF